MASDRCPRSCLDPAVRWSGAVQGPCVWCDGSLPTRHAPILVDVATRVARAIGCSPCAVLRTSGKAVVAGLERTKAIVTDVREEAWNRS